MSDERRGLSANETFEIKALAFRKQTGHWPPGKDYPAVRGSRDEDEDRKAWDVWNKIHGQCADAIFASFQELFGGDNG